MKVKIYNNIGLWLAVVSATVVWWVCFFSKEVDFKMLGFFMFLCIFNLITAFGQTIISNLEELKNVK